MEVKNEYVKAQELAVYGHSLEAIDAVKAAVDKKKLEPAQINKKVEAKIDAHIASVVIGHTQEKTNVEVKKVYKKK